MTSAGRCGRHRAVLFDLDGTLADTLATIANVANFALRSLALPEHPIAAYKQFVGDGIVELCWRVLPRGGEATGAIGGAGDRLVTPQADDRHTAERLALHAELLARARARYATHYLDGARLYGGIAELLAALAQRGARLGVLSNKPDALTKRSIEGLGIAAYFTVIAGQRDEQPPKPDPAGAFAIAQELGVAPSEVLYVGDTSTDMETARRAGFAAVGVRWGFRSEQELVEHGARWIVSHPREILALYDGLA